MRCYQTLFAALIFVTSLTLGTAVAQAQTNEATAPAPLNGPVIQRIRDKQTLTIAYDPNQSPFSLTGDDGLPTGYTVDLCKIVASQLVTQLDMKLMDVRWIKTNTRSRFDAIESGDADLECSATSNTLDRQRNFAFSLTTFIQGATFAVRNDANLEKLDHLTDKKLAVVRNTTTSKLMKQAIASGQLQAT
ncbi:MAG: transporter substrate-binding domain-containing protein, partial [Fluviibacter sp.]